MRREWHKLASYEAVLPVVSTGAQWWTSEQGGQIERSERIEHHDLVGCIGIDGLIEGEESSRVVEGLIESRSCLRILPRKARDELVEIALALSRRDRRSRT